MIKFFKNIRHRLLLEDKSIGYLKYAIGEIVLVVIGILIALSINNWNEARKTKLDEIKVLSNIKLALISDLENQFAFHLSNALLHKKRSGSIIAHMIGRMDCNDSLEQDFLVLSSGGSFSWTPQMSAYQLLETKGIDIIKNDGLLAAILDVYNLDYPFIQNIFDNYLRNVYDYGRPIARKKFRSHFGTPPRFVPVNYNLLFDDVEFLNTIEVLNSNSKEIERRILKAKSKVETVIKMIDDELQHQN